VTTQHEVRPASPPASGAPPSRPTSQRFRSLDGLRGIAAFVVVVHHCLLTSSTFAKPYQHFGVHTRRAATVVTYTPLHLFWDGTGAVLVFFVLSGFVLTLPWLQGSSLRRWVAYYPQRALRLYLPAVGSVVLALVLYELVHRPRHGGSYWLNDHGRRLDDLGHVTRLLALVVPTSHWLDSPLWSLRWEVWFSILLPVFVLIVVVARSLSAPKLAAFVVLICLGYRYGHQAMYYLPMFGVGAVLAAERHTVARLLAERHRAVQAAVLVVGAVLLEAPWLSSRHQSPLESALRHTLSLTGAAVLVVCFLAHAGSVRLGNRAVTQWLGRHSFALYLVHEPIVVSVAVLTHRLVVTLVVGIPVSLLACAVFYRLVEGPSHRLSQWVGRRLRGPGGRGMTTAGLPAPSS
jgi:peptidoglycan/LPS O-acetylase OafA/YrhL